MSAAVMNLPRSTGALQRMVLRYKAISTNARERAGKLMETAVTAGVQGGTGAGLGYWSKKWPETFASSFGVGVPVPLLLSGLAYGAAAFGVGRGMEQHVESVGHAALTVHGFLLGQDAAGSGAGAAAAAPSVPGLPGIPPLRGTGVTQADIERMANAA